MEKKLREKGKSIPEWVIAGQKMPSCSVKIREQGLGIVHDEDEAIARIQAKHRESV